MKPRRLFERQSGPHLLTERLEVRFAGTGEAGALAAFFRRNELHFRPWDPPAPPARFTAAYWQTQARRALEEWQHDRALRLHMFLRAEPDVVVGRIGFSQISRGPFQSCMLGYQLDEAHQGRGLMHEALGAGIAFMFGQHGMHRIQANYLEENLRSATLLARLGFQREGLARDYLFVAGRWRDHVLCALTNPAFDTSVFDVSSE